MAKIPNPRKRFNYSVTFVKHPLNPFLCQRIQLPEVTIEQTEHGDANYVVKTGGRLMTGNLTLDKLSTTSGSDTWSWDWLFSVQDPYIGGGLRPQEYKEIIKVDELAEDGVSVLNSWLCDGCWLTRVNGNELSRMNSENVIDSLEFSVDRMEKI